MQARRDHNQQRARPDETAPADGQSQPAYKPKAGGMMETSDLYFYLFIIVANVAVALIGWLWSKLKSGPHGAGLEAMAKTLVYAAAQQLPGATGSAKLNWVMSQAAQLGGLNTKHLAYFRLLVEERVKELKLAEQAAQPVLIDATAQPTPDEIAGAVLNIQAAEQARRAELAPVDLEPAVGRGAVEVDENASGWGGPFTGWRPAHGPDARPDQPIVIITWDPENFA